MLSAILGAAIALGSYKVLFEETKTMNTSNQQVLNSTDSASFVPTTFNRIASGITTNATTIDFSENC